jgi:hypothetical protein
MAFADELADLKRDLKEARIPVKDVLAIAGVNRTSWTRWSGTHSPRIDRWAAVQAAAEQLLSERARRAA